MDKDNQALYDDVRIIIAIFSRRLEHWGAGCPESSGPSLSCLLPTHIIHTALSAQEARWIPLTFVALEPRVDLVCRLHHQSSYPIREPWWVVLLPPDGDGVWRMTAEALLYFDYCLTREREFKYFRSLEEEVHVDLQSNLQSGWANGVKIIVLNAAKWKELRNECCGGGKGGPKRTIALYSPTRKWDQ